VGKKRRAKKLQRKLAAEALSILLAFGIAAGLDWFRSFWAQLLVYGAGYFLAYRWLMADFLPPPVETLEKRKK